RCAARCGSSGPDCCGSGCGRAGTACSCGPAGFERARRPMPAPDSAPTWNFDSLRLPKSLDDLPQLPALRARLSSCCRKLWEGGAVQVPVVSWSEPLASALASAQRERHLLQGIEQAERTLDREAHGLSIADARSATERGSRV